MAELETDVLIENRIDADAGSSPTAHASAMDGQPLGDVCAGCQELSERLEQLERRLAMLESPGVAQPMGTTLCYWLCVGFHALVAFGLLGTETAEIGFYVFIVGASGTMSVCHVMSTRPFPAKVLRTALSISVVVTSMILGLWLTAQSAPSEMVESIVVYLPLMCLTGWLGAKLMVWTRGWKIIPPGGSRQFIKPGIRDLMVVTLVSAIAFGAIRYAWSDDFAEIASEWLVVFVYITVPVTVAALMVAWMAKVMLTAGESVNVVRLMQIFATGCAAIFVIYAMLAFIDGGFGLSGLTSLFVYCLMSTLVALTSPLVTFVLMRSAGYRFAAGG